MRLKYRRGNWLYGRYARPCELPRGIDLLSLENALASGVCAGAAWAAETSMVFDGVKPHVKLPGEPNFDFTTAMTVEAWVKFDKHPTLPQKWEVIMAKGESAWGLTRFRNLNRVTFRTHNGLELHDLSSPVDLDPLTWYHVAGTFDAATKTKALYENGEHTAT